MTNFQDLRKRNGKDSSLDSEVLDMMELIARQYLPGSISPQQFADAAIKAIDKIHPYGVRSDKRRHIMTLASKTSPERFANIVREIIEKHYSPSIFLGIEENDMIPMETDEDGPRDSPKYLVEEENEDGSTSFEVFVGSSPVQVKDIVIHPAKNASPAIIEILNSEEIKTQVRKIIESVFEDKDTKSDVILGAAFLAEVNGRRISCNYLVENRNSRTPTVAFKFTGSVSRDLPGDFLGLKINTMGEVEYGEAELIFNASSPIETQNKGPGGIDFRTLPMTCKPMGGFCGLNFALPKPAEVVGINVDKELSEINLMVERGIAPSGERVKELVAACYHKQELAGHAEELMSCLMRICKLEEDMVAPSDKELKEALVIVDSL